MGSLDWRWSFGLSASAAPREMTWCQIWTFQYSSGLPQFFCRWTLNPFLDSNLFWQPSCKHLYPIMTCLVAAAGSHETSRHSSEPCTLPDQDIVLSPVPCQCQHAALALKNTIISTALKVWRMMLMSWRQIFVPVGITKLMGLLNRTYAGCDSQDLSVTCCSRDTG